MNRAFVIGLALVAGCSTSNLDVGAEQAAVKSPKSCSIDGVSYDKGATNPANPCETCKPEHSLVSWTVADDGTRCDDGNECTRTDSCQAGACVGADPFVCKPKKDYKNPIKAECCLHGTATIGPSGGTVTTGNGTTVEIPLGAVDASTTITVSESETPAPEGAVSPLIDFGPDGIVFAHPVKVTIPLTRSTGKLTTFWTKHDGSGTFEPVGGTIVGDSMVVEVTHFSSAYVADDPGLRSINGTETVTWVAPNNIVIRRNDLTTLPVEALVADGSGGYTSIPGVGATDGTFHIDDIPAGVAIIHAGKLFTQLDISAVTSVDLGTARNGRFDQVAASDASSFAFDVGSLTTWQDADRMEFFCSNDSWIFDMQTFGFAGFPATGDSSISNLTVPETAVAESIGTPGNLVVKDDGANGGDVCTLAHLQARQTSDAVPLGYVAMAETFDPDPFDQTDGDVTTLSGSFVSNTTPSSVTVDIQMQDYVSLLAPAPASAFVALSFIGFDVLGAPGGVHSIRAGGNTADFMLLDLSANPQNNTVATNLQYGQPLTGTWDSFAFAAAQEIYVFPVPNSSRFASINLNVTTTYDLDASGAMSISAAPRLTAPQSPTINGADFLQPLSGVGLTPTIAWSAPARGTPDVYEVDLVQLVDAQPPQVTVARMATAGTSLTVPSGILIAGQPYFIVMIAENKKPIAADNPPPITAAPFYFADATDSASAFSAIFTP